MSTTFYSWIGQFKNEDSPMGDIAKDIYSDKDFPKKAKTLKPIKEYLESKSACGSFLSVLDKAFEMYSR